MSPPPNQSEPNHDRRGFFREALFGALRPAADYLEKKLPETIRKELSPLGPTILLRPPGALSEPDFLDACYRCGTCADACPANSIDLVRTGHPGLEANTAIKGTPYIDPNRRGCVICEDLSCMKVCPSGALRLVDRLQIRVGMAIVNHHLCVRSHGEACTTCVDDCPIGHAAIRIGGDGRVEVIDPSCSGTGCTGCGMCQERCPVSPVRAIQIRPYPERHFAG